MAIVASGIPRRIALIDRGIPSRTPSPNRKSKKFVSLFLVVVIAISLMAMTALLQPQESNDTTSEPPTPARIAYTTHVPILIDGDAGFLGDNSSTGISWGGGTADDPYVIEGWDIQGPGGVDCIAVLNANVYFVIRDCRLHDCGIATGDSGIYLLGCSNGMIEQCECFNNDQGILVRGSTDIVVRDSNCHSNSRGISVSGSEHCLVTNNNCSDGNTYGIYFEDNSRNNRAIDNNCSHNTGTGISIGHSWNDTLIGNRCEYNRDGFEINGANSSSILIGNWCNFNIDDGIFLMSSNNNSLLRNECSENGVTGIEFSNSCDNTVTNNTIRCNGDYGVFLWSYLPYGLSRGNQLSYNDLSGNTLWGIIVSEDCESNRIWNNTLSYNNGSTETYDSSNIQACDDGIDNWWNSTDGYGNYWSDWTTPDADFNGIVDEPYDVDGSAGAKDYYPRTTPAVIPEFSSPAIIVVITAVMAAVFAISRRSREKRP